MGCNMFYIEYLIYGRPKIENLNIELFNEFCTLTLNFLMLIYTDFV